jgi:hypothetical protein|tara:strand:- start:383 stop:928 length:546 start_codon:yes stop_codon:yes gene_type:complete
MATVYEIIQGLSQAAANAYDGALTEDGEAIKVGLEREKGDPILDKRVIDGFNVVFYGNMMCLTYESDVQLKEVHASGFESDVDQRLSDIAKWLKKEYRKITGQSVTLTEEGEVDVMVQNISNMRTWMQAKKHYKVGGLSEEMQIEAESKSTLDKSWKSFLDQGGWKGKRPKNDTRPKNSGE